MRRHPRWKAEVVGQEHQSPFALGVVECHTSHWLGIQPRRLRPPQDSRVHALPGPISYPPQGRLCRPDSRDVPIHGRQNRPYQVAK